MADPDNIVLTEQTVDLKAQEPAQILLLACGALAHEVLALKKINKWQHMDLTCLPAKYHLTPEKIISAVEAVVLKQRENYDSIFVLYADCGTGGMLENKCVELGVEMLRGPHCYSFFEGNEAFAARGDEDVRAFFLTDFLARQFDSFVWKPMGLDRHPQLKDMYFGNYTKLVYQAQREDADLLAMAKSHAERLGLEFEYRFTGYGDLEKELASRA